MSKNQLTEGADRFWYGYLVWAHPDECPPEDSWAWSHTLSNRAFSAGARWAVKQTSELSPYVARFIEMMILLGYLDDDAPLTRANTPIEELEELVEFADVPF